MFLCGCGCCCFHLIYCLAQCGDNILYRCSAAQGRTLDVAAHITRQRRQLVREKSRPPHIAYISFSFAMFVRKAFSGSTTCRVCFSPGPVDNFSLLCDLLLLLLVWLYSVLLAANMIGGFCALGFLATAESGIAPAVYPAARLLWHGGLGSRNIRAPKRHRPRSTCRFEWVV